MVPSDRAAVGHALLTCVAPEMGDACKGLDCVKSASLNKLADLRTAVIGYPGGYDYAEQLSALDELDKLKRAGKSFTDLSPSAYSTLAKSNHSFRGPTFATMTALRRAGIDVDPYDISSPNIGDSVRRIAADKNVGSVIQVGALSPENADILANSGKHFGRLATDYGSGGFLQPRYHLGGNGSSGSLNGMYIDPSVKYNSVYVPGGKLQKWPGIPQSTHVVPVGRLAVAPMFSAAGFNPVRGQRANALMITGGGSGLGLPFEYRTLGNLGATTDRSLMHPAPNLLDHILTALRNKHGADNVNLNFLTGINPNNISLTNADYEYLMNKARGISPTPDIYVGNDLWAMKQFLDKESPAYRHIMSRPGGPAFLQRLAERYKGLNLIGRVELPDMARYYGNSDYIFDLPGSSLGEIAQMQGKKTPGMVHLVPRDPVFYPRHFLINAQATNRLMQPGARHNIVRVDSPTLQQDIAKAVNEGGFKDWGRASAMSSEEAMRPLVKDIRGAHRLRELKSMSIPKAEKLVKTLYRIARRIR